MKVDLDDKDDLADRDDLEVGEEGEDLSEARVEVLRHCGLVLSETSTGETEASSWWGNLDYIWN